MKNGIKSIESSASQSSASTRLDLSLTRFNSESGGKTIKPEESTGSKHHILETEPDPMELDTSSELDEYGLSPVPSNLSDTDVAALGLPVLGASEASDDEGEASDDEQREREKALEAYLDPVLSITAPCIGSIVGLKSTSPLCDFDDLLRLATQQTAQEIADSVNKLKPWSMTRREVQALIQQGIQRVALSRDVSTNVVAQEIAEVKRENGVLARETGRPRRNSGDEVVSVYHPATGGSSRGVGKEQEEEE